MIWKECILSASKRSNEKNVSGRANKKIKLEHDHLVQEKQESHSHKIVPVKSTCSMKDKGKKKKIQSKGRATKQCCFVECLNKNKVKGKSTTFSFSRIPPHPSSSPPTETDTIRKHITFHKKRMYRREFLDQCGSSRFDPSKEYRIYSKHKFEEL